MITGNKGEWSEIYALFKLLGDKELYPGDENLEKIPNTIFPIIKILRTETNGNFEYSIEDDVVVISGGEEQLRISILKFKENAALLLTQIKTKTKTFSVPEIEQFMKEINCISLKASSSAKTDITIVVHDSRTHQQPTLGFSIKSQLGNPSTLLNAGKTTNFIFKIEGIDLSAQEINQINQISTPSKIMDRITSIQKRGGSFKFIKTEKKVFSNNLILIDSLLPEILAELVLLFYSSKISKSDLLVNKIEESNPLEFDSSDNHEFYSYKIKRFLTDIALGMMPSKVWNGAYDATGGYLIIKNDGSIVCYHIYNKNSFEDYLLKNTKFDTASSSRHNFGKIYSLNDELRLNLNLQIRFIK